MTIFAKFDDMTWPCPGKEMANLSWVLRYGKITREDELIAASIIEAYIHLIACPGSKRNQVVAGLRKAMNEGC